jgi:hypothetical protein
LQLLLCVQLLAVRSIVALHLSDIWSSQHRQKVCAIDTMASNMRACAVIALLASATAFVAMPAARLTHSGKLSIISHALSAAKCNMSSSYADLRCLLACRTSTRDVETGAYSASADGIERLGAATCEEDHQQRVWQESFISASTWRQQGGCCSVQTAWRQRRCYIRRNPRCKFSVNCSSCMCHCIVKVAL